MQTIKWAVAKLEGENMLLTAGKGVHREITQSSVELYDSWIFGPLPNS